MLHVSQILVTQRVKLRLPAVLALSFLVVACLAGCGQKGKLYLPKGDAAQGRATLPEITNPSRSTATGASAPASAPVTPTGQANPVPGK